MVGQKFCIFTILIVGLSLWRVDGIKTRVIDIAGEITEEKPEINFNPSLFRRDNYYYVVEDIVVQDKHYIELQLALNREVDHRYKNNFVYTRLKVVINCNSYNELSIRVTDPEESRFELPHHEPFPFIKNRSWSNPIEYTFDHATVGERFFFRVLRKSTQEVIFDTKNSPFIFTDKYLEVTTIMRQEKIYGLGDRRYTSFELGTGEFSFWAADATRIDHGKPGEQIYGHHPMYLRKEAKGTNFHVLLMRNTYGMQVKYVKGHYLTYKIIGGYFDFRFFLGDKYPETSIKLYHNYVNGYTLHPFWVQDDCHAFGTQGFHQSRWGYNTTKKIHRVFKQYNKLRIPIDSLWSDIDYMKEYQDFTFDTKKLDLNLFHDIFNISSSKGLHWSSIIDVGIANSSEIQSGIWIDMNEYSNFVPGEITDQNVTTPQIKYPFNPCGQNNSMEQGTISLNATHYSGKDAALIYVPNYQITQYDMHNINGFSEGYTTYNAAKRMGHKLPFILSRSTLFGSGKYMQHWTGDNMSTWEYLRLSIGLIENFQMFGIPLVGADICGFNGDTNPELCARWHQVGSLYPFSRNHNSINNIDQEPYAFPEYPYVLSSAKKAIRIRYQLLKFYYHLFVRGGGLGTVFRPLFFEFHDDSQVYDHESQFMLGEYLMAAPVIIPGNNITNTTEHSVYFPENTVFFDFYTYEPQMQGMNNYIIPYNSPCPLFIRSGKIVHIQDGQKVVRSRELLEPFTLLIALDQLQSAEGQILSMSNYNMDENVVDQCINNNCLLNIKARVHRLRRNYYQLSLSFTASSQLTVFQEIQIRKIVIIGLKKQGQYQSKHIVLKEYYTISSNQIFFERFMLW